MMNKLIDCLLYLAVAAVLSVMYVFAKAFGWLPWDDEP